MLDLSRIDLDDIAQALSDQTDYEHRWLINPDTGETLFWTSDAGIDGKTPIDLDELDELPINPLPSYVWYQDMADFAEHVTDERAPDDDSPEQSRDEAPSAGSKTNYTTSSQTYSRPGTPSATLEPDAARSSGWPTVRSSTPTRPHGTSPSTPTRTSPSQPRTGRSRSDRQAGRCSSGRTTRATDLYSVTYTKVYGDDIDAA